MSFENLECARCSSNIIDIKYFVDGTVEIYLYHCKTCGAWRESYCLKIKKPVIQRENRSNLYPDNLKCFPIN